MRFEDRPQIHYSVYVCYYLSSRKQSVVSHDDDVAAEVAKHEQSMEDIEQEGGLTRPQTQSAEDLPSLAGRVSGHDSDEVF